MSAVDSLATVAQTAQRLGLSEARIHQLLRAGELNGPPLPAGRLRHVPGAGRVTETSIDALLRKRATPQGEGRSRATQQPSTAPTRLPSDSAFRAAAQELKVQLDSARDALRAERERSRRLLVVTSELVDLLRDTAEAADGVDRLADGYSAALTQLLSPDDGSDLHT